MTVAAAASLLASPGVGVAIFGLLLLVALASVLS